MGSGESKHRTSVRPPDQPLPPGKPTLVSGAPRPDPDVVTIRWDPPEWNGARITGYIVEHRRIGSPHWVKATPVQIRYHQLTLSGLEPGMRYQFRVFAECATGKSEPSPLSEPIAVSYHRTFASAPCFIKPLEDTVAIENEKVEFTVHVQGTPTPKLVWYKDGFEIYSSRRQRITMDNDTSTLVIHQAAFSDEGEIKCSATNKAGHVVTKARLQLEAPPTIRLPRQYEDGLLFELGETVRLKISVSGRPQPKVVWLHDGEIVMPGGRIEISTTDRYTMLKLSEATRQDRGEYQVKAVNRLGEDVTSFLVTITDRPLPPGKANVVMTLGRSVTLSWSPPSDDGGCKIGNFIVEYYRIGWNMWLKAATCRQLTTTLGDLIEGSEYKFRVKAENPYGISEPSEESDVIFIPDPKRGLLEPPARNTKQLLNDELSEEWLEARKRHNNLLNDDVKTKKKSPKKSQENVPQWDEESPIPSPVMLANQVLTKVKMAPKRGWSDDSQGSPPRSPERPVPPKRKSKLKHMKAVEEIERIKPIKENMPVIANKIEYHSTEMKKVEENLHGSSELMLVLLPNSRATTEEREAERQDTIESLKNSSSSIAPPISLSAPELGCCEPIDVSLIRFAVSSSELLHERAMARFYQETADEEAEEELKRKYGIERKRSFERPSKPKDEIYPSQKEKSSSTENIGPFVQCSDEFNSLSKSDEDNNDFMSSSNSPTLQESEDKDTELFVDSEKGVKESIIIDHEEQFYDEVEKENIDEEVSKSEDVEEEIEYFMDDLEEDTYHPPNMELSRVGVTLGRPVTPESIPSSEDGEKPAPSEFEDVFMSSEPSIIDDNLEVTDYDDIVHESQASTNPVYERSQSPLVTQPLKPILKVRDQSQENIAKSTSFASRIIEKMTPTKVSLPNVNETISEENKTKKKVRIEEPESKYEEGLVGGNVLLTGEVARNRRKQMRQNVSEDEIDSTMVVVSHYSDIVREYGCGKKPRAKLYLDYEDLKAAADRTEKEVLEEPEFEKNVSAEETVTLAQTEELQTYTPPEIDHTESRESLEIAAGNEPMAVKRKSKSGSVFLLDFVLFLIACWLYMFSDERLAIPILILMVYRQVHETVEDKINKLKKWRKKS